MDKITFTLFLLGLDSLVVSLWLGALETGRRLRYSLATLFGLCDGVAVYLSHLTGPLPFPPVSVWGPVYGASVLAVAWHGRSMSRIRPLLLLVLPFLLAIDNLATGVASISSLTTHAFAVGTALTSGFMALAGLSVGTAFARLTGSPARHIVASCLLTAAIVLAAA